MSKIVICAIVISLNCSNCIEYKRNIEIFNKNNPNNNLSFYFIEYAKYDILQNYYQLNNLMEYPKVIIFRGNWDDKEFLEGPVSVDELEEIYK